jgi:hypothetical protein
MSKSCPSAEPEPGSILLGVMVKPSIVAYIVPASQVTTEALESLRESGVDVENRLRFAGPCVEHQCVQWTGARCGLIDNAVATQDEAISVALLPKCSIRSSCRWFSQHGRSACAVCPDIIRKPSAASRDCGETI